MIGWSWWYVVVVIGVLGWGTYRYKLHKKMAAAISAALPLGATPGTAAATSSHWYHFWKWRGFWGLAFFCYAAYLLFRFGDAEIWFTWLAQPPSWPDIGIWLQRHWLAVVIGVMVLSAALTLLVNDKEWTPVIRKATLGTAIAAVVAAFVWHLQNRVTNTCTMPYRLGVVYICTLTADWTPALPTKGSQFPADAKFCYSYDSRRKPPQWEKLLTAANTYRWRSEDGPMTFYYGLIRTGTCPTDLSKFPHIEGG